MGSTVLFVEGNRNVHSCGCFLHVIVRVKPAHDVVVVPQSAHAKKVSVEVGMIDYIVCGCIMCLVVLVN